MWSKNHAEYVQTFVKRIKTTQIVQKNKLIFKEQNFLKLAFTFVTRLYAVRMDFVAPSKGKLYKWNGTQTWDCNTKCKTAENSRSRHQRDERRMVIIKEKSSRNKRGHGEPKGADEKGLSEWRKDRAREREGERETSGVFGTKTHRPAAVHYKGGWGVGRKEENRWDLRWVDH